MFQWRQNTIFCWDADHHNRLKAVIICFSEDQIRSFVVTLTTKTDCRQSSSKDRVLSSLKYMTTAYSLFWWSASPQKIVFCLHWNIWWLPTVCFGGQRHNKKSYLCFTETYDDCLQSVLVVSVTTKDRILSSLKHMMTAYSLFGGQRHNKRSYLVFTETYDDCLQFILVVSLST
jgi:hypothetical protein